MSDALWQPFTPAGGTVAPMLVRGEGKYLFDDIGRRLLDGTAGGVACVILGHGRTEIADAVAAQLRTLEYYCLFGFTHPSAEAFAETIAAHTPGDLDHVFFTNSGSEAVETALKMARAYWQRTGHPRRTRFVSLDNAYHGMNFGGISVGGLADNRSGFGPLLEGCSQVPAHDLDALAAELDLLDPATVAAVILEPVQAAGGVYPPPEGYLAGVRELCDRHGILLILDEVVCGWGRLGHWFGGHRYGVVADIMTTAKGLTSAYVPMGAAIANDRVHDVFVGAGDEIELMHGYTYSGHPAACAAGLAVVEILEREQIVDNARTVGEHLQQQVRRLERHEIVAEVRGEAMLAAVEIRGPDPAPLVAAVVDAVREAGVLVRAQDDHIGIYPPLIVDRADVDVIVGSLDDALAARSEVAR